MSEQLRNAIRAKYDAQRQPRAVDFATAEEWHAALQEYDFEMMSHQEDVPAGWATAETAPEVGRTETVLAAIPLLSNQQRILDYSAVGNDGFDHVIIDTTSYVIDVCVYPEWYVFTTTSKREMKALEGTEFTAPYRNYYKSKNLDTIMNRVETFVAK